MSNATTIDPIPPELRAEARAQPDPAQALAQLERTVAGVQSQQREALQHLIYLAKKRPREAEAYADEIVATWSRAAMGMLSTCALGFAQTEGSA